MKNLHTLDIAFSHQLTDNVFIHLPHLHTLNVYSCKQLTDEAFKYFKNLHSLNMSSCDQTTITDAAFTYLNNIRILRMEYCHQNTITNNALSHLQNIHNLHITLTSTVSADGIVGFAQHHHTLRKIYLQYYNNHDLKYIKPHTSYIQIFGTCQKKGIKCRSVYC